MAADMRVLLDQALLRLDDVLETLPLLPADKDSVLVAEARAKGGGKKQKVPDSGADRCPHAAADCCTNQIPDRDQYPLPN